jgi:hypothetical protein
MVSEAIGGQRMAPKYVTKSQARSVPLDFDPATGKPVNRAGRRRTKARKPKMKGKP